MDLFDNLTNPETTLYPKITFADVLFEPQYSEVTSRSQVDVSVEVCKGFKFETPIICANMKDLVGKQMLLEMYRLKSLCFMHRFIDFNDQLALFSELKSEHSDIFDYIGASVGVKPEDYKNLAELNDLGVKIVCVDIAHLDSKLGLDMVRYIKANYPDMLLVAGNVATADAAERAWKAGADIVKCGIGASGVCRTRMEAGAGVPQLSAIFSIYKRKTVLEQSIGRKLYFISDGGHKYTSDCGKALAVADMVMLGSILSGTSECPGEFTTVDGVEYKSYNGSSTHKAERVEGVKTKVPSKGKVSDVMKVIVQGIQSTCSYSGAFNLTELKQKAKMIKISQASMTESSIK